MGTEATEKNSPQEPKNAHHTRRIWLDKLLVGGSIAKDSCSNEHTSRLKGISNIQQIFRVGCFETPFR